jgi:hypothetical protein
LPDVEPGTFQRATPDIKRKKDRLAFFLFSFESQRYINQYFYIFHIKLQLRINK